MQIYTGFLPKICPRLPKLFEDPIVKLPGSKIEASARHLSRLQSNDSSILSESVAECIENTKALFEATELGAKDRFGMPLSPGEVSAELSFLGAQLDKIHRVIEGIVPLQDQTNLLEGLSSMAKAKADSLQKEYEESCNSYYRASPSASVRIHKSAPLIANWKETGLSQETLAKALHYAMRDAYDILHAIQMKEAKTIEGEPILQPKLTKELPLLVGELEQILAAAEEVRSFIPENLSNWPFGFLIPQDSLPLLKSTIAQLKIYC